MKREEELKLFLRMVNLRNYLVIDAECRRWVRQIAEILEHESTVRTARHVGTPNTEAPTGEFLL